MASSAITRVKEKAKVTLSIPEGNKIELDGFDRAVVGDKVVLMCFGEVTSVAENAEEWERGKRMSMTIQKCRIDGPATKTTINDAIKAAIKTV